MDFSKLKDQPLFNVVLVEPEIPTNTGNIGRICVGTQSHLHLVEPLGFEISDKRVKRAGLDYWPYLNLTIHPSYSQWQNKVKDQSRVFYLTKKGKTPIYQVAFQPGDWLVFGKEAEGLPEDLIIAHSEQTLTIPHTKNIRSFNLSNAVSMVVSEGMRQILGP